MTDYTDTPKFTREDRERPPTHPGVILQKEFLEPYELSVEQFSKHLNLRELTVRRLVAEQNFVSVRIAQELGSAFGVSPVFWLNLQHEFDCWRAENNKPEGLPQPIEDLPEPIIEKD